MSRLTIDSAYDLSAGPPAWLPGVKCSDSRKGGVWAGGGTDVGRERKEGRSMDVSRGTQHTEEFPTHHLAPALQVKVV